VQCDKIWTKDQRDQTLRYLKEAQDEIEQISSYFLTPTWVTDEKHKYLCQSIETNWGKLIEAGIQATTDIADGAAVSHASDPATIGPVATIVTDTNEIRIYHPDTDVEIIPSSITISGGNVTIEVPRCRMVLMSLQDNPSVGLTYSDTSNFESAVDIKRVYNDPSTNAVLVSPHSCNGDCLTNGCSEYTQTACIYLRRADLGYVDVVPATYTSGSWLKSILTCCNPEYVKLNYKSGLNPITRQAEDAIVRLAHSKMPEELCGCDTWSRLWKRDTEIPDVLTRERLNCPFGLSNGARS